VKSMGFEQRIAALRKAMYERQLDAVLVTGRTNVFYLSGFTGTSGDLFITSDDCYILTDFRYMEQVGQQAPIYNAIDIKEGIGKILTDLIQQYGIKSVGFEDRQVTFAVFNGMKEKIGGAPLVPMGSMISDLREVKLPEEQEILRKAAEIADMAFAHVKTVIRAGVSEIEVAAELEYCMRKAGASAPSFDIIVASGQRGAMPHGTATPKLIQSGELVTMDFGCIYEGYCSDITRTIAVGEVSPRQREVYNLVHFTQLKALGAVKAGVEAKEVDAMSRRILGQFGLDGFFGHGLGHGVGIDVHEQPTISTKSTAILKKGMVVTVEPGVYIPGELGVRIEDTVVITEDGIEILTKSPKELIII